MGSLLVTILVIMIAGFSLGLYVAVTIGFTALGVGWLFSDRPIWDSLSYLPWNTLTTINLLALPLFILMGEMLLRAGVTENMYGTLAKWLNRLPGGLLHTNIVASGLFACVSGSSAATAATIGAVALPFMGKRGYNHRVMLGSIAGGGTLGILIPPSIVLIVYGVLAGESIGQLYIAGIVPGFLLMLTFLIVIIAIAIIKPAIAPKESPSPLREKLIGLFALIPIFALIFIVLGTIYLGIATPTEAAAFGVSGALVLAVANRRFNARMLRETLLASATTSAMIMFILIGAFLLQFVMSFLGVPLAIARLITELKLSAIEVVVIVCLVYIILGMFMESMSMIVITVPVLVPVLRTLGVDLVWFGIIVVMVVEIGMVTPPMGLNLFILHGLAARSGFPQISFLDVFIGVLPFLAALLITITLIIMFPEIALWLVAQSQ
ncbi:MAG: TRAP transporter large permease subunit [Xanthobacteraceae bacterium]